MEENSEWGSVRGGGERRGEIENRVVRSGLVGGERVRGEGGLKRDSARGGYGDG